MIIMIVKTDPIFQKSEMVQNLMCYHIIHHLLFELIITILMTILAMLFSYDIKKVCPNKRAGLWKIVSGQQWKQSQMIWSNREGWIQMQLQNRLPVQRTWSRKFPRLGTVVQAGGNRCYHSQRAEWTLLDGLILAHMIVLAHIFCPYPVIKSRISSFQRIIVSSKKELISVSRWLPTISATLPRGPRSEKKLAIATKCAGPRFQREGRSRRVWFIFQHWKIEEQFFLFFFYVTRHPANIF